MDFVRSSRTGIIEVARHRRSSRVHHGSPTAAACHSAQATRIRVPGEWLAAMPSSGQVVVEKAVRVRVSGFMEWEFPCPAAKRGRSKVATARQW